MVKAQLSLSERKITITIKQRYINEALNKGFESLELYIDALKSEIEKLKNENENLLNLNNKFEKTLSEIQNIAKTKNYLDISALLENALKNINSK
jgi:vacuolar-type H+-ATPase subunit E/Vma4